MQKLNEEMFTWKPEYETGVEDIDYQHHFFFNLIARIYNESLSSDNRAYKNLLMSEVAAYARFHFLSEENMMIRSGFPGMQDHKKLHFDLLDILSSKLTKLEAEATDTNRWVVISFLVDWFLHHTAIVDQEFARYILNK